MARQTQKNQQTESHTCGAEEDEKEEGAEFHSSVALMAALTSGRRGPSHE